MSPAVTLRGMHAVGASKRPKQRYFCRLPYDIALKGEKYGNNNKMPGKQPRA